MLLVGFRVGFRMFDAFRNRSLAESAAAFVIGFKVNRV